MSSDAFKSGSLSGRVRRVRNSAGDDIVVLRVPRQVREAIRRIAAFEEVTMEAVTRAFLEPAIADWEKAYGTAEFVARVRSKREDGG